MPARVPLVSIVTPALNMGRFLEETIRSVLDQDYPRIEYLVMDGGSTDTTLEVLERYRDRLRFVSAPDGGQAAAINRGFDLTSGEIFAFLNADDTYLPGAVSAAIEGFLRRPQAGVIYGNAWHVSEGGSRIAAYPVEPFDAARLARRCFICQPAAFLRRDVFTAAGKLDPTLRFALDYDLWIRVARRSSMQKIDAFLAASRMHAASKTMGQMRLAMEETIRVLKRHYGYVPYNWLYGYEHHRLTGQLLALQPPGFSASSALSSLLRGARHNWRHPVRYARDILATGREGMAWLNRS